MAVAFISLAAGKSTHIQSDLPKVLKEIAGAPLIVHAMRARAALEPEKLVVVAGHKSELIAAAAKHRMKRPKCSTNRTARHLARGGPSEGCAHQF